MRSRSPIVVRKNHPAFAGSDRLGGLEAENAYRPQRTGDTPAIAGRKSLRRIFDDGDFARACEFQDVVHIAHVAVSMHGYDRPGLVGQYRRDIFGAHAPGVRVDFAKDRPGVHMQRNVRGREKPEARNNNFVTRRDSQCQIRHVQRRSAIGRGQSMSATAVRREVALKTFDERAAGNPRVAQGLSDVCCSLPQKLGLAHGIMDIVIQCARPDVNQTLLTVPA